MKNKDELLVIIKKNIKDLSDRDGNDLSPKQLLAINKLLENIFIAITIFNRYENKN